LRVFFTFGLFLPNYLSALVRASANCAFTIPAPQPPLIEQFDPGAKALTESERMDRTLAGVMFGCIEYINPTIPETKGAAMLVPSFSW
jgi:hypothetical protein